jgi:hypothetical protein
MSGVIGWKIILWYRSRCQVMLESCWDNEQKVKKFYAPCAS